RDAGLLAPRVGDGRAVAVARQRVCRIVPAGGRRGPRADRPAACGPRHGLRRRPAPSPRLSRVLRGAGRRKRGTGAASASACRGIVPRFLIRGPAEPPNWSVGAGGVDVTVGELAEHGYGGL